VKAHDFGGSAELLASRGLRLPRGRAASIAPSLAPLSSHLRARVEAIDAKVLAPLADAFPGVGVSLDLGRLEGLGYYAGPCVRIEATAPDGTRFPLVDGGSVAWTRALLSDARERFVTSGVGPDLICARFSQT
jgi:hypothetical protein